VLTISVQKQEEQVNENEDFVRREFNYTSFQRSFQLPETVDPEQINAHYENGVEIRVRLVNRVLGVYSGGQGLVLWPLFLCAHHCCALLFDG